EHGEPHLEAAAPDDALDHSAQVRFRWPELRRQPHLEVEIAVVDASHLDLDAGPLRLGRPPAEARHALDPERSRPRHAPPLRSFRNARPRAPRRSYSRRSPRPARWRPGGPAWPGLPPDPGASRRRRG